MRDPTLDQFFQAFRVTQIEDADSAPPVLILVRGTDSAAGSSDLLAGGALRVDELVIWKHEMRAVTDVQSSFDVNPICDQLVDFGEQCFDVEHNTIPDRAAHARMKYPARYLVENERL